MLFVGTKKQAQETIKSEAERCGMPYITTRWLGGTLTNFRTIRQRVEYMAGPGAAPRPRRAGPSAKEGSAAAAEANWFA